MRLNSKGLAWVPLAMVGPAMAFPQDAAEDATPIAVVSHGPASAASFITWYFRQPIDVEYRDFVGFVAGNGPETTWRLQHDADSSLRSYLAAYHVVQDMQRYQVVRDERGLRLEIVRYRESADGPWVSAQPSPLDFVEHPTTGPLRSAHGRSHGGA